MSKLRDGYGYIFAQTVLGQLSLVCVMVVRLLAGVKKNSVGILLLLEEWCRVC